MGRDDERTWTELVESFHASTGDTDRTWPAAEDVDPATSEPDATSDSPATTTPPGLSIAGGDGNPGDVDAGESGDLASAGPQEPQPPAAPRAVDDDHFVPPTPPPLPRTDMITMLAWIGVFGSPVLFAAAYVFGQSLPGLVSFIAVVAFVGGFALLISRLRGHDPHDPDSGAVV